jgi:hypothetical protein
MQLQCAEDLLHVRQAGDVLNVELIVDGSLGLEFAEFGNAAAEDSVRLGSGAVYGLLLFFGAFVLHGIEVEVVDAGEVLFDETAAAEAPGGSHDFSREGLFEFAYGS